jgi:predicted XRE-type DNA-binding protein
MKNASNKPIRGTHGNVLDAELYQAIPRVAKKYSQKKLQIILGEPQPRASELLNGKIANKSVSKLLSCARRLGMEQRPNSCTRNEVLEKELALAD